MAQKLPLSFRLYRAALRGLAAVAPEKAAARAVDLYTTPQRHGPHERERPWRDQAERFSVSYDDTQLLQAYAWGVGPTILLVHGWSGRGLQLHAFVAPLVARGYRVVGFDVLAHGASDGERCDLLQYARSIRAVTDHVLRPGERLAGLIAHSFGGPTSTVAIAAGLPVDRVALIGAPAHLTGARDEFLGMMGLGGRARDAFSRRVEDRLGHDCWEQIDVEALCPPLGHVDALIVHDRADRAVAVGSAIDYAAAWPGARLFLTDGLGHHRVLRDPSVVAHVTSFIVDAPASQDPGEPSWIALSAAS